MDVDERVARAKRGKWDNGKRKAQVQQPALIPCTPMVHRVGSSERPCR